MSDLLITASDTIAADVVARLASFDRDELPTLSSNRDPWSLVEPACPSVDGLLTAWLREERPDTLLEDVARDACGPHLRAIVDGHLDAVAKAVAVAGTPEPVAGEPLHIATTGSVLLGDDGLLRAAHAAAARLLDRFERRKHPLGLTGNGKEAADLVALGLLRATWRVLTQVTGDPRFLNAALKLAEWTRRTVPDADLRSPEPWHALRRVIAVDRHELSAGATALHLLAALRERDAVHALRSRR